MRVVENKVQNDNLINLNNVKSFSDCTPASASLLSALLTTPSPKIKVSKVKFSQQQPQALPASLSSSTSSESESTVRESGGDSVSPNKMQAETGTIAELQKYQNKYLKNRRHTLANTAINLR
jgi:hypothetical protein